MDRMSLIVLALCSLCCQSAKVSKEPGEMNAASLRAWKPDELLDFGRDVRHRVIPSSSDACLLCLGGIKSRLSSSLPDMMCSG